MNFVFFVTTLISKKLVRRRSSHLAYGNIGNQQNLTLKMNLNQGLNTVLTQSQGLNTVLTLSQNMKIKKTKLAFTFG